jgi:16S rRNA (cytidine1402-2'-O)-methyltransferase
MSGTLYVVATPIGNLEDVTLRALRVLREVALIAAEDTRRTSRLLQHYSISTPTTSLHEHNERARTAHLIARLSGGESIALVADAGTPLLSDPGATLVAAAHGAGIRVEPIPGPSAAMAALSGAGFEADLVHFAGFPPAKGANRREWFDRIRTLTGVLVLYEAPHRIRDTLSDLIEVFGDQEAAVARELTKAHEELVVRPISSHIASIQEGRGEYTVVVQVPKKREQPPVIPADSALLHEFGHSIETGETDRRSKVRKLAEKYQLSTREIYGRLERAKKLAE